MAKLSRAKITSFLSIFLGSLVAFSAAGVVVVSTPGIVAAQDDEKKPRVSWLSDKWLPEEFVEDIVTLAEKEGLIEIESEGIPSIGFILSVVMISMAAISLRAKSE